MMKEIKVLKSSSKGIAVAKACIYKEQMLSISEDLIDDSQKEVEYNKFEEAKAKVVSDLKELAEKEDIFAAHLALAEDFTFIDGVKLKVVDHNYNIQFAIQKTVDEIAAVFDMMTDEYMKERAADIKDIGKRYLSYLQGNNEKRLQNFDESVVLFAKDLYPSDTAGLDLNYVKGFVTEEGGITSHVSIMAKGIGLPALVGVQGILDNVNEGDLICLDAKEGIIVINPDEDTLNKFRDRLREFENYEQKLKASAELPAETVDGKRVRICANVGSLAEVQNAVEKYAEGIGLFRSEFLYMENTHFPDEEEQFQVYKSAAEACPQELTIRTLDIGGDKALPYYKFEKEENPFLGWRAIRISLEMEDMFKAQLKAILRASAYGHVRIMFPMIISLEELRMSRQILEKCMDELGKKNIPFDYEIEVGMMIETPASVLLAEQFANEVDFFSIGTNDLTQYLLAVDRGNQKISNLYNSFHPAVLKAIYAVIQAGHKNNIKVGMCGEFASNQHAVKILLGMGLDEFSMSPGCIAEVKYLIRKISSTEAKDLADKIIQCDTVEKVLSQYQS